MVELCETCGAYFANFDGLKNHYMKYGLEWERHRYAALAIRRAIQSTLDA